MIDRKERLAMIEKGKGITVGELGVILGDIMLQESWIVIRLVAPECVLRVILMTQDEQYHMTTIAQHDPFGKEILDEMKRQIDSQINKIDRASVTNEEFRSFVQGIYEDSKNQVYDRDELCHTS